MKVYKINPTTREIVPERRDAVLGVYNDNNTDGAIFKLQGDIVSEIRTYDIRINFLNYSEENVEIQQITDATVEGDTLTCTWILDRRATNNAGEIIFTVCFTKADGSEWNTTVFKDKILEGLEPSLTPEEQERFETYYDMFVRQFTEQADAKKQEVLDSIPDDYTEVNNKISRLSGELDLLTNKDGAIPPNKTLVTTEHGIVWKDKEGGISEQASALLVGLLKNAVFTVDASEDIETLYDLLTNGGGEVIIHATSVSLDKMQIQFLSADEPTKLTARPVPSITTDKPVWISSNPQVAVVDQNGNVTAVGDGNCVIKVQYNENVFAECSCFCTLGADIIYKLPEPFIGDGNTVIDTGFKMCGTEDDCGYKKDFTIAFEYSCTNVTSNEYAVSLIHSEKRYLEFGTSTTAGNIRPVLASLGISLSTEYSKDTPLVCRCVITHDKDSMYISDYLFDVTHNKLYKNVEHREGAAAVMYNNIYKTISLGALQTSDGGHTSYMTEKSTIKSFAIYNRKWSDDEIENFLGGSL